MTVSLPQNWWLEYLGKPWAASPNPPYSFNCGELVRHVHLELCGIDSAPIPVTNASSRKECAKAMLPDLFGLEPLPENEQPRDLDVAFMGGHRFLLHCGIAVETCEGLKILHCPEAACGVCLDSLNECRLMGFSSIKWFRHKEMDAALIKRGMIHDQG